MIFFTNPNSSPLLGFFFGKLRTNIELIKIFSDTGSGMLNKYAMWLKLKHIHKNSKIYKYSLSQVARKSGLTRNGIRRYIKFFIEEKWVRMEGEGIIFISHDALKKKYGVWKIRTKRGKFIKCDFLLNCTSTTSVKDIHSSLRYEIPRDKQRKFNYVQNHANNLLHPDGAGAKARYTKAFKFFGGKSVGAVPQCYQTSISSLAIQWNVSPSTASRLIKKYEAQGRLKVFRHQLKIVRDRTRCLNSSITEGAGKPLERGKFAFRHKNLIFIQQVNGYIF